MNELEFKHHLKDLVHGHHHPEEHDWGGRPVTAKPAVGAKSSAAKQPRRKTSRKK